MTEITIAILAVYFLPTIIAAIRVHHNGVAIAAVNVLFGWTVLGWCIALIWSLTATRPHKSTFSFRGWGDRLRSASARPDTTAADNAAYVARTEGYRQATVRGVLTPAPTEEWRVVAQSGDGIEAAVAEYLKPAR